MSAPPGSSEAEILKWKTDRLLQSEDANRALYDPSRTPVRPVPFRPPKRRWEKVRKKIASGPDKSMWLFWKKDGKTEEGADSMTRQEKELHQAARKNDIKRVQALLSSGVNVNAGNQVDRTALHWAAGNGNTEIVKMLSSHDANIDGEDKYGMTALLWAAWFGYRNTVGALVFSGANATCENKQGLNILHCAAQNGHVDVIQFILEDLESFDLNGKDKNGKTAFHIGAEHGKLEPVEYLIGAGCDVNARSKDGSTAVHYASKNGHPEVLTKIIQAGAEVNERDKDGKTPLHLSAEEGWIDIAEILLDNNADVNADAHKEVSPLHMAAQNGHPRVSKILIDYGADVDSMNHHHMTALHLAAQSNWYDVCRLLIESGCDINALNARTQTPIHLASENGLNDVCEMLLKAGAKMDVADKQGKNPLGVAARGEHIAIVDMMIKAERYYEMRKGVPEDQEEYEEFYEDELFAYLEEDEDEYSDEYSDYEDDDEFEDELVDELDKGGKAEGDHVVDGKDKLTPNSPDRKESETGSSRASDTSGYRSATRLRRRSHNLDGEDFDEESADLNGHDPYSAPSDDFKDEDEFSEGEEFSGTYVSEDSVTIKAPQKSRLRKVSFRQDRSSETQHIRNICFKLATKYLKSNEWKRLARIWKFSEGHIKAIEHQYAGTNSYREHGYRMLLIWLHGECIARNNPIKGIYEALLTIDRRKLADDIRRKANAEASQSPRKCAVS
ncbi:ankyrin repeat and death domain-containing protein 1A-like isoform X2 [Branchiostoma floridae]|uniref:Ankyrin repeat and death domain-containing protein 1A-like isoform X2 n=1 Tax=Branchiostoma floridae TaxID=7739 RepID=A0A9J7KMP1_BRAFL|nr:ankyrin repeat and death domain-containing protein 1A-like isoform X2 [Branchiostoma floridae]